jgi:elongation factor 3
VHDKPQFSSIPPAGETFPEEGAVWRHPNLRLAYVAQHAFHHVEQHLDQTPAQYIWWR